MLATMLAPPLVCADVPAEPADTGWALALDNDWFFPGANQDRDYTGGISFTMAGRRAQFAPLSLDRPRAGLNHLLRLEKDLPARHSIEYGLVVFTPQELHDLKAQVGDRPFANLLYVASTGVDIDERHDTAWLSTLSAGVLGAAAVGDMQKGMHHVLGLDDPVGWGNQVSDGGELTARYSIARTQRSWQGDFLQAHGEVTESWRLSVGYLSQLTFGVAGRMGILDSPWWSYNPQIADYAEKSVPVTDGGVEHYWWGGLSLHLRAYNAFLQGQFRDSNHTFAPDELRPVVAEAWAGYTCAFSSGWRLSYALRGQSSEIRVGPGNRAVIWGGIVISRMR